MRFLRRAGALMTIALAIPSATFAQQVPNISGTWILQVDKSDFGMGPPLQGRTDVVDHKEPNLTIKRTLVSAAGENTADLVYVVDGKPHKNMAGPAELTSTLRWEGQTLVTVSTTDSPNGEITITDRMSLSEDGKTLTQVRMVSLQGQEVTQTMVLAKQ